MYWRFYLGSIISIWAPDNKYQVYLTRISRSARSIPQRTDMKYETAGQGSVSKLSIIVNILQSQLNKMPPLDYNDKWNWFVAQFVMQFMEPMFHTSLKMSMRVEIFLRYPQNFYVPTKIPKWKIFQTFSKNHFSPRFMPWGSFLANKNFVDFW